jgi:tetratricopeptide (TPR) repeat protein
MEENKPKFCEKCGSPISDNFKYCENCGNKISISGKRSSLYNSPLNRLIKMKPPAILLTGAISAIVLMLILIGGGLLQKENEYVSKGNYFLETQDYLNASLNYDGALLINPNNLNAALGRVSAFYALKDTRKYEKVFEENLRAVESISSSPQVLLLLGEMYYTKNDTKALSYLNKSIPMIQEKMKLQEAYLFKAATLGQLAIKSGDEKYKRESENYYKIAVDKALKDHSLLAVNATLPINVYYKYSQMYTAALNQSVISSG